MNHLTCHLFGELLTISIFTVFSLGGLSLPWEDSSRVLPEETELGSQMSQMREEHWRAQLPKYMYPSNCPIFSSVPWCLRSPWFHPGPWDSVSLLQRVSLWGREGGVQSKKRIWVYSCFSTISLSTSPSSPDVMVIVNSWALLEQETGDSTA